MVTLTIARQAAYQDGQYDAAKGRNHVPLELDHLSESDADWVQGEYANGYSGRPFGY